MSLLLYVFYDLCLSLLCSLVAFVIAAGVVFQFKTQFLFLLCLPYLIGSGNTSFLVSNLGVFTELYFLLFRWLFFLILPFFIFIICFYVSKPFYYFLFFKRLLFTSRLFFVLFLVSVYASFRSMIPFFSALILLAIPERSHAISFALDFTPDSWLRFFFVLVCLLNIFLFTYIMYIFKVSILLFQKIYIFRLILLIAFFLFLSTFIPYDLVLHVSLLVIFFFLLELPIFLRCFLVNYFGRVA